MDELIVPNIGHPHSRAQPAMTTQSTTLGLSPLPLDLWRFRQSVPARKESYIEGKGDQGRFYSFTYGSLNHRKVMFS